MAERVGITALGARGDGIAATAQGPLFVPFALAGEEVSVIREGERGRLVSVDAPAPERVTPFCPWFTRCGGCVAQHMAPDLMAEWKRSQVSAALTQAGLPGAVDGAIDAHGQGRRRITLHARRTQGVWRIGLMAASSHDLVEIETCPITVPDLAGAVPAARVVLSALRAAKPLDLQVTATAGGLDLDLRGHGPVTEVERQALIAAAGEADLARLSLHGDVLVERRAPLVVMGRAEVHLPPGSFLQATARGEDALAALALEGLGRAKRVADLFAGAGPFALRAAEAAEVHAVEGDAAALSALDRAARTTPGLRRVSVERRDLFRRPLLAPELARFDAVVMDPPRAGAEAQARQLASSAVPVVVSVSCDAGTFARDVAILVGGGYTLDRVTAVDQFRWSSHVEIVGVLRKAPARRRR